MKYLIKKNEEQNVSAVAVAIVVGVTLMQ